MNTESFFKHLVGKWVIKRSISGHAQMQGEAQFSQIKTEVNALYYEEQGQLTLSVGDSHKTLKCYRSYVYRYQSEQDVISVYFVEGNSTDRLFHTLQFSTSSQVSIAQAEHVCAQDIYHVVYKLIDKDNFEVLYKVKGPQKNYQSYTFFRR